MILRFMADCCTKQSPDANALKENEPLASFLSCLKDSILQLELFCRATAVPYAHKLALEVLRRDWLIVGTPEQVAAQISRYRDEGGITHFNWSFWAGDMPQNKFLRSMERFAAEVMPRFPGQPAAV